MDAITTDTTAPRRDGRTIRGERTREYIITAARKLMIGGNFRPSIRAVATEARVSARSVFQHFADVEGMHRAALDVQTRDAVAALIVPLPSLIVSPMVRENMAYAAVFGRPFGDAVPATAVAAE